MRYPDSETIGSGTVRTSTRRSIRGVAAWSPLPMYYSGTPLAITCWYIYIFINYYLLEHRSTFDNCIVKVDYGIFIIQPSNQLLNIAFYNKRLMLALGGVDPVSKQPDSTSPRRSALVVDYSLPCRASKPT